MLSGGATGQTKSPLGSESPPDLWPIDTRSGMIIPDNSAPDERRLPQTSENTQATTSSGGFNSLRSL